MLRNRSYLLLLIGQFISALGDWAYYIALSVLVYQKSKSGVALGFLTITYTIPGIVFAPIAGWLADRYNCKKIMAFAELSRAAIMFVFPFINSTYLIYILVALEHTFSIIIDPCMRSIIPTFSNRNEDLLKANSYLSASKNIAKIIGGILGGWLVSVFNPGLIFVFDGVTLVLSAIFIVMIKYVPIREMISSLNSSEESNLASLREGWKIIKSNSTLKYLTYNQIAFMFILSMISTFLVVYTSSILKVGPEILGILNSSQSIGSIFASVFIIITVKIVEKYGPVKYSQILLMVCCLSLIMMIFIPVIPIVILLLFIFGCGEATLGITIQTQVQVGVTNGFIGRVTGIQGTLLTVSYVISSFISGLLIDMFELTLTFVLISGLVLTFSILMFTKYSMLYKYSIESHIAK